MRNFTIPYKLKHFIDVIMQAGILFCFPENGNYLIPESCAFSDN
ncbi:MAG: NAD(P)H-dependent oxidoreductase [Saprospiraceae bacterium]|nr:NAD(P)H-dependent oxidoreductase [Saprospiraceae bacterium]